MDDSFEEISNKINNGIPLSEEEQQSFNRLNYATEKFIEALKSKGVLTFQPIGEKMALLSQKFREMGPELKGLHMNEATAFNFGPALIESHKKGLAALNTKIDWDRFRKATIRFQELYEKKKRLWEKDRNYYKNKGFDREFEEVLRDLSKLVPEVKKMRIGEVFGMPDDDFRRLFDDWFVAYEAQRNKLLEEARARAEALRKKDALDEGDSIKVVSPKQQHLFLQMYDTYLSQLYNLYNSYSDKDKGYDKKAINGTIQAIKMRGLKNQTNQKVKVGHDYTAKQIQNAIRWARLRKNSK